LRRTDQAILTCKNRLLIQQIIATYPEFRAAVEIDDMLGILATSSVQSALTINQNGGGLLINAQPAELANLWLTPSVTPLFLDNWSCPIRQPKPLSEELLMPGPDQFHPIIMFYPPKPTDN